MNDQRFLGFIGDYFRVHDSEDEIELETWTQGGVNMFVRLEKNGQKSFADQFEEYVDGFSYDIDELIDVHREGQSYKNNFTIRQSVHDFESYNDWLESIVEKMKGE